MPDLRRPEISGGEIRLPLAPGARHDETTDLVLRQLADQLTPPDQVKKDAIVEAPSLGILRRPDLAVLGASTDRPRLVVEVVSPHNPGTDHQARVRDYAATGIPVHLLVDPRKGTGIIHDEPGYARRADFAFGDIITVGPWTLDTGVLRTYS
ncbi:Uma2 family endonuclease [Kitasatospora griseola]|uniref:Uma2 family endonuclease n=1 Tax=Kitasatospora griseola TaxID=2064 RepID=UPI003822C4E0